MWHLKPFGVSTVIFEAPAMDRTDHADRPLNSGQGVNQPPAISPAVS
jgi:hypothetical protein